jgi:hypothetical protein
MISELEHRPFQAAIGIPRGGVKLGMYLNEYGTGDPKHPYLICDDVLTTGGSMNEYRDKYFSKHETFGWVVWNRGGEAAYHWVNSLFSMHYNSKEYGTVHMVGIGNGKNKDKI